MQTVIEINVVDQNLIFTKKPTIASGGVNENRVNFTFSEEWEGFDKTASFYRDTENVYKAEITNNTCVVPEFVTATPGTMKISVFGEKNDEVRTASVIELNVVQGALTDAPDPMERIEKEYIEKIKPIAKALMPNGDWDNPDLTFNDINNAIKNYAEVTLNETVSKVKDFSLKAVSADVEYLDFDMAVETMNRYYEDEIDTAMSIYEAYTGVEHNRINVANFSDVIIDVGELGSYMKNLVNNLEDNSSWGLYTNLWRISDSEHLLKLPYIKTDKMSFTMDTNTHPTYVEELGFDVTMVTNLNGFIFDGCTRTKKLILTGLDKSSKSTVTDGGFGGVVNSLLSRLSALQELYTDKICAVKYSSKAMNRLFYNLTNLRKIGGFNSETKQVDDEQGKIDFTECTSVTDMFYGCSELREVYFVANTLKLSLNMSACSSIGKASVLSLVNAIDESVGQTLSVSANIRNSMMNWFAKFDETTGLYVECENTDPEALNFADIISVKNWSVA